MNIYLCHTVPPHVCQPCGVGARGARVAQVTCAIKNQLTERDIYALAQVEHHLYKKNYMYKSSILVVAHIHIYTRVRVRAHETFTLYNIYRILVCQCASCAAAKNRILAVINKRIKMERDIERYLIRRVEEKGAMCIKILSAHISGMPDRLCTRTGGMVVWVELKADGEHPRALQQYRHRQLKKKGQQVEVISSKEQVDNFISKYYDAKQE